MSQVLPTRQSTKRVRFLARSCVEAISARFVPVIHSIGKRLEMILTAASFQEENQFLANPIDEVRKMPENIQRMIGYSVSAPYCGWVDLKDPISFVRDIEVGYTDA